MRTGQSDQSELFAWLAAREFFGVKLGLEQTRKLFDLLGAPDRGLRFIHLAGSNGKGSTGAMIEAGLRGAGCSTGFYSSPHLVSVCERFRINGRVADAVTVARALAKVRTAAGQLKKQGCDITYFEAATAAAALLFAEAKVDFVVWETGMGGRLDATNIVTPIASVITSIALEHQKYLGATLSAIAGEKAGIIKESVPVFAGCTVPEEALEVIRARAERCHAPLAIAVMPQDLRIEFEDDRPYQTFTCGGDSLTLSLPGPFQRANAAVAALVLDCLARRFRLDHDAMFAGLKAARWPARFQVFPHENMLFDGAHNPECAHALANALREVYPGERFEFICGFFADKDADKALQELLPLAAGFHFVEIASARKCHPPEELCARIRQFSPGMSAAAATLEEALSWKTPRRKALCGSLHLCGEALALRAKTFCRSSCY